MRNTMIVKEVVKTLGQVTRFDENDINWLINNCTTYRKVGEPTRVNANDLEELMVNQCGKPGARGDWNKLASMVCTTMEC
jgi:hypothetical protein